MSEIYYKGRMVTLWDKHTPDTMKVRKSGESWLEMMDRTQAGRDMLERENEEIRIEFIEFLKTGE